MRLFALLVTGVVFACRPQSGTSPDRQPHRVAVDRVAGQLTALGFEVDVGALGVEVLTPEQALPDFEALTRLAASDEQFAGVVVLRRGLGILPPLDAVGARRRVAEARRDVTPVYYAVGRGAVVFQANATGRSDLDRHVAVALMQVFQDREMGGLGATLLSADGDNDAARARQCVVEGHAGFVSAVLIAAQRGVPPGKVLPLAGGVMAPVAGEVAVPCPEGARFVASVYRDGGWPAVLSAVATPPESSEAVLHPEKRDEDFPTRLGLGSWPEQHLGQATLVRDDVVGELTIRRLLVERGLTPGEAFLAATGWDGDRLRIFALPSGERVAVWWSVWDRPLDATQFREGMTYRENRPSSFWIGHRDREVHAFMADRKEVAEGMKAHIGGDPIPDVVPSDARSTQRAEATGR